VTDSVTSHLRSQSWRCSIRRPGISRGCRNEQASGRATIVNWIQTWSPLAMLFKFACYYPAEKPLFFSLNIESDAWVDELLEAIQAKLKLHSREVKLDELHVFKVKFVLSLANSRLTHSRRMFL
jgi:hypothetical protein